MTNRCFFVYSCYCSAQSTRNYTSWEVSISLENSVAYLQLVGYKQHGLAFGSTFDGFIEDVGAHTSVNSTERVIQQEDGALAVEGTRQAHSLTLSSAQVGTSLSNLQRKRE